MHGRELSVPKMTAALYGQRLAEGLRRLSRKQTDTKGVSAGQPSVTRERRPDARPRLWRRLTGGGAGARPDRGDPSLAFTVMADLVLHVAEHDPAALAAVIEARGAFPVRPPSYTEGDPR